MSLVVIVRRNYTMDMKAYLVKNQQEAVEKIREEYSKELGKAGTSSSCNGFLSEKDLYAQVNYGFEETEIRAAEFENV